MKLYFIAVFVAAFAITIEGVVPHFSPFELHEYLKQKYEQSDTLFPHVQQPNPLNFESAEEIDNLLKSVKEMAEKAAKCLAVPGLNIGIVIKNQTYTLTAGLDSNINTATNFGIGSSSKAFTSMLAAQLVEKGQLDWHTPVKEYTPHFKMLDPVATARLTIRDMLTHKTGMPDHSYDLGPVVESDLSRAELFYGIRSLEPAYDFRSEWRYSNAMLMAAGFVEEQITGEQWEDLVTERIFNRAGMKRSRSDLYTAIDAGNLASPHILVSKDPVTRVDCGYQCNEWVRKINPAGGIYSNVEDLTKWIQIHLNTSEIELVNANTLKQLHTAQTSLYPFPGFNSFAVGDEHITIDLHSYAYNWFVENYRGLRHVHHGGVTFGFNTFVSFLPDLGFGFVGLANGDQTIKSLMDLAYYTYDLLVFQKSWVSESLLCALPAMEEKMEDKQKEPVSYGKQSDDDISEFQGEYFHPYMGNITFTYDAESDVLVGAWGAGIGNATYLGKNFFVLKLVLSFIPAPNNVLQMGVEFLRNYNGVIDSFASKLQDGMPAMVFTNEKWIPRGPAFPVPNELQIN